MDSERPFDVSRLFEGYLRRLQIEAAFFSRSTDHRPELGRLNESHLVRLLRNHLPPKFGVGTGFIVCGGSKPSQSPQCDIVLYDALNNAPFYNSDTWSIFPIEIVYGVIEVKTKLSSSHLSDAFELCSVIRKMTEGKPEADQKSYLRRITPKRQREAASFEAYYSRLPPRFYVFGYSGWKDANALESNFKRISESHQGAHIHGVCNLTEDDSFYVEHLAYRKPHERFSKVHGDGFRRLLANLPLSLESMLPTHRTGLGFDPINIAHYNLQAG